MEKKVNKELEATETEKIYIDAPTVTSIFIYSTNKKTLLLYLGGDLLEWVTK